ncbi:hypothetical protein THAOC_10792 [Thalassiosira oceanica]|uniref:Uncharacterized protein n=1 Tax=Thalassiosira oceanica TaxID=159749 RepID=K0SRP6_THAOC|nr:hypothetical protein THAOC_10792 [Thalassiosira oceanica]|eukprot:EJK68070.1 hypothetical protein THAOC_10792 [Thalassiosira oceanica]
MVPLVSTVTRIAPQRPLAYHTNKTNRAEALFGPAGDDNGRRYEPLPRDRTRLVTAFMPSRRRLPATPGGPRKAALSLLEGLLSTLTMRARRAEPTDLRRRIYAARWRKK